MRPLNSFLRLPTHECGLLLKAAFFLVLVQVGLRIFPFRLVRSSLSFRRPPLLRSSRSGRCSAARIAWAVDAASRHLPVRGTCLSRALAVRILLSHYGLPSILRIGVAKDEKQALQAHAWVESEGKVILGGPVFARFIPLARNGSEDVDCVSDLAEEDLLQPTQPGTDMDRVRRSLYAAKELLEILDRLERRGIPAIPLKGPVLAASLYGDVGMRYFSDLDLLVLRRDAGRAKEELIGGGYHPRSGLSGARLAAHLRSQCHHQLISRNTGLLVELHWQLMPDTLFVPFDEELLWKRKIVVSLGGRRVPALSWEDQMLFLCAHGSKHLWERLGWVRDVARMLEAAPPLDWEYLRATAEMLGMRRMLFLGLSLAGRSAGARLPGPILEGIRGDPAVRRLTLEMEARLRAGRRGPFGFWEVQPFYLRMRERWVDKVRDSFCHALTLITPTEEEWNLLSLPDFLFPLYYLIRPVRLAGKYGKRLWRGLGMGNGAEAGI